MRWNNLGFSTIKEAVDYHTGGKADEILNPSGTYKIQNADYAAAWMTEYCRQNVPITIVGDYDCDGICASAGLKMALEAAGATNVKVRLPKRMSEGYGLSKKIISEIDEGVVITVDNGIAAIDSIQEAKKKGLVVILTDHHMPVVKEGQIVLPEADLIVDPHVPDDMIALGEIAGTTFQDYCGAGLVYRIAGLMNIDRQILNQIAAFAAIATVADVMPLLSDNRNIYQEGIYAIAQKRSTMGFQLLIDSLRSDSVVTEGDIGFSIAPMLNAPGRLLDDGAQVSLNLVLEPSFTKAKELLEKAKALNEERKLEKAEAVKRAYKYIDENCLYGVNPIVIADPKTKEGIVGLVAGTIAEQYNVSCICFTEKNGTWKGSARSCEADDMKASLDQFSRTYPGVLLGYGGHKGAAGLSIRKDAFDQFQEGMQSIMSEAQPVKDQIDYDLELKAGQVKQAAVELARFAPFGEGNPPLVFKIEGFQCVPIGSGYFVELGNGKTIKFNGAGCEAVGFGLAKQYHDLDDPTEMDLVGKIGYHYYNGIQSVQIEILDFKAVKKKQEKKNALNLDIDHILMMNGLA